MSEQPAPPAVGFVGLGHMGRPMVQRLLAGDCDVVGYDISPGARADLAAQGVRVAGSLADIGRPSGIAILMLPDSDAVGEVARGLVPTLRPGALVVDMSSSDPFRTRALAAELASAGLRMVDAPVSGGVAGASAGTLTIMAGGDDRDVTELRPVLERMGRVVHVGPAGAGHAVKALNNLLSAGHLWITSEAMVAAREFGLDPATVLGVFNCSSGRSGSTETKWPNFIMPGTFDSGFSLQLMAKDVRLAVEMMEECHVYHALSTEVLKAWGMAAAELTPSADHTEVARWIDGGPGGAR